MNYTFSELTDVYLIFGKADMNCRAAARPYAEQYTHRRTPRHTTFTSIDTKLREHGTLRKSSDNAGNPCLVLRKQS